MTTFSEAVAVCDDMYRARSGEESSEDSVEAVIDQLMHTAHYEGMDVDKAIDAVEACEVLFALDVPEAT